MRFDLAQPFAYTRAYTHTHTHYTHTHTHTHAHNQVGEAHAGTPQDKVDKETHYAAILKQFHKLKYTDAVRLDRRLVINMSDQEVLKFSRQMFKKYADGIDRDGTAKMSMKALKTFMGKALHLEKKYGKKFPDLVTIFFVWADTNNDSSIGFEEFENRIDHLLFLQKCPTSRDRHLSKYFRLKK